MVVEPEIFESNLKKMVGHCKMTDIHPRGYLQAHKSAEVTQRQITLGADRRRCATVADYDLLSHGGMTNILPRHQPTSKNNIGSVVTIAERDPRFRIAVDGLVSTEWLDRAAASQRAKFEAVVGAFAGLTRHGIAPGAPAVDRAKKFDSAKNLKLVGIVGYSGAAHTYGFSDRMIKPCEDTFPMLETAASSRAPGLLIEIVTGGTTVIYNIDSEIKGRTELQAGSFVFLETSYRQIGGQDNLHEYTAFGMSLTFLTSVISRPHPHQCTIDAGNKALLKTTDIAKGLSGVKIQNQGAEYEFRVSKGTNREFNLGERVELYRSNLDMSTNVYDRYYVARGEQMGDVWSIMGCSDAALR